MLGKNQDCFKAFLSYLGFPVADSDMKIYLKWFIKEGILGEAV